MSNLATQIEDKTGCIVLPQAEYDGRFDVVCFQVNYDSNRISNDPLSPLFETRKQAQEFLAEIKKTTPDANMGKYELYYSSENEQGRLVLFSRIVNAGG